MESLESKIDRLSPVQRNEVEDFVDFLLSRSGEIRNPHYGVLTPPPLRNVAPPPLTMIEPVHIVESPPIMSPDLSPSSKGDSPAFGDSGGTPSDPVSRDYMDYGQFEQQPSPAEQAVKNVKAKLGRSEEQDRSKHLLDWID